MKVLMIRPGEHPCEIELAKGLDAMYEALDCRCITASYPWEEPVALVTDDEGLLNGKQPNRYIHEMGQPIMGNFFLCGLGYEDFADLPEELMKKFKRLFWMPEAFIRTETGLLVLPMNDGTAPDCGWRERENL